MKSNALNDWKKRNKLSHKEASEILDLKENTLYTSASLGTLGKKTLQLMNLIDTIREKDLEIDTLKAKIVALATSC